MAGQSCYIPLRRHLVSLVSLLIPTICTANVSVHKNDRPSVRFLAALFLPNIDQFNRKFQTILLLILTILNLHKLTYHPTYRINVNKIG